MQTLRAKFCIPNKTFQDEQTAHVQGGSHGKDGHERKALAQAVNDLHLTIVRFS